MKLLLATVALFALCIGAALWSAIRWEEAELERHRREQERMRPPDDTGPQLWQQHDAMEGRR